MEVPKNKYPELHHNLVVDVLSRLPVNSLERFKGVSKAIRDLISHPDFVKLHQEQSMKKSYLLAISQTKSSRQLEMARLNMKSLKLRILAVFSAMNPSAKLHYMCPISCDIICFITNEQLIYLVNPSNFQVVVMPISSISSFYNSKFGFVYSSSTNEYKVVQLFLRAKGGLPISNGMECQIFTFGFHRKLGASSWRKANEQCPRRVYPNSTATNGRIYWLIRSYTPSYRLTSDDLIVAFNSETETFNTISRPSSWPLKNYRNFIELMPVDGNLCITDVKSMRRKSVLDVWMLRENSSWEQFYSINLDNGTFKSLCDRNMLFLRYICREEILFIHSEEDRESCKCSGAQTYNTEKNIFRRLVPINHVGVSWESLVDISI